MGSIVIPYSSIFLLIILISATMTASFPMFSDSTNNKIGGQRKLSITAVVKCFQHHNNAIATDNAPRKKYYASTSGATAVLYDEDGVEVDCSEFAETAQHKYDQHCFFSPLNCFFSKYRLPEGGEQNNDSSQEDINAYDRT